MDNEELFLLLVAGHDLDLSSEGELGGILHQVDHDLLEAASVPNESRQFVEKCRALATRLRNLRHSRPLRSWR